MNGAHDMGGMHGFGPVIVEENEPLFYAPWERDVATSVLALFTQGRFAVDQLRRNIERQPAVQYLSNSYYQNWLNSLEALVLEGGIATAQEIANGVVDPAAPPPPPLSWVTGPTEPAGLPRFAVGDHVRALVRQPKAHTREPRYVRGRVGEITHHYGVELLPELAGEGIRREEHLYRVRFTATELWGKDACPKDTLYIDLVESYIELVT